MRGRLEPKDTVERFWGLKFIGFPNLSDETPKPINLPAARGVKLINLTLWPLQGASVSRVTHTHLRHSPKSPPACGSTA